MMLPAPGFPPYFGWSYEDVQQAPHGVIMFMAELSVARSEYAKATAPRGS